MHDSCLPIIGAILLANMIVAEVIIGTSGSGLYGTPLLCIVTVFVDGLMIGRKPEYVGKKIEAPEIKMRIMALACVSACSTQRVDLCQCR